MKYLSVCSGIEAATAAWHPLGWEAVGFSEIEKFPSAVLAHHYPDVPNYGDMNDHERWPDADIDVLVGGTPCQSFSVAGLRKGMADPRGNLALVYLAIADQYRPRWLVWENVPGVLSSDGGRDFGSIIGGMVELGYSPCWRVLDAQYFGLAQRRKRVFVVASSRDWRDSAKVLLEPEGLLRNPAPRRESREGSAPSIAKSIRGCSGGIDREDMHTLIPDVANPLTARMHKGINTTADEGQTAIVMSSGQSNAEISKDLSPALNCNRDGAPIAFAQNQRDEVRMMDKAGALAVRRLTPLECERLQGFPDGYTNIPGASDSGRYKALGNSMAVPVMQWIGRRIADVDR